MAAALPEARWGPPRGDGTAMGVPLAVAVLLHGAIGVLLVLGVFLPREMPEPSGGLLVELVFAAPAGEPAETPMAALPLADEPLQLAEEPAPIAPVAEPPSLQAMMPLPTPLPPLSSPPAEAALVEPIAEPPPLAVQAAILPAPAPPTVAPAPITPIAEPRPMRAMMPPPASPPAEAALVEPVAEPPPLVAEDAILPALASPTLETAAIAPIAEPPRIDDTLPVPPPAMPALARMEPVEEPPPVADVAVAPAPPPPAPPPAPQQAARAVRPAPARQAVSRPAPATRAPAPTGGGAAGEAPASAGTPSEPPGPPLITAPRFRHPPRPPEYPRRAVELDLSGTVVVRALLDPAGNPRETRVHRSSGHPILDAAAIAAVRRWAFEPASVDGRRIEAWVEVPVRFRLH